jgi:signal transduction histidine kinase/ActR/RegA family two-component response regulator
LAQGRVNEIRQEKRYLLRDGRAVSADLHLRLMRGRQGEPKFIIGMAVDTTEQKQLEAQLLQSQRMETIGRLAGGVAHDFNNLLTVIRGYCDLVIDRTSKDPVAQNQLSHIDKATGQATALTKQLLAFSRRQVLQPKVFDLNALVLDASKMLKRLVGEDIELEAHTAPDLGAVKADPSQIEQVILNLVVNARDAMPGGGKISIETANVELDGAYVLEHLGAKAGNYVMMAVSDTGSGIDEQTIAHIFEPFFTTKQLGQGTGLGLSMVYGIVKQSGGSIWVYSEKNCGTTFKVYLPRADEAAQPIALSSAPAKIAAGNETILLVEDDPMVRELSAEVLERKGYEVLEAATPALAIEVCVRRTGTIQLLLTDVVMPGMNGGELARRVQQLRPDIRVLFMSGYTDNAVLHTGELRSGLAFIQKPFTPSALAKKVREILDEKTKDAVPVPGPDSHGE